MKKLIKNGKIVKATISYRNNTYVIDRTVYVDGNGIKHVKVNGSFIKLCLYMTDPNYRFHGYWEKY